MKRMIPLLLSILLLTGCGGNSADGAYQQITQEEAKEMMDTQEVIILDVREQDGIRQRSHPRGCPAAGGNHR